MSKSALIIGIDSNIGKALAENLRSLGWNIFGTSRRTPQNDPHIFYVDLEQEDTIKNIHGYFDVVYACAALTNMAFCETNPELSKQINFTAQVAIAKHCINKTGNYVFLSTAGVFDGAVPKRSPNTMPIPKCVYGTHKAMSERFLLNLSEKVTIIRTPKVITRDNKMLQDWVKNLQANQPISPFNDMTLCAVSIDAIVTLLRNIGERPSKRILHISGKKDVLYSEFASMLAAKLNKPLSLIHSKSYLTTEITPTSVFPYSSLDMSETTQEYGIQPCDITDMLPLVFQVKISVVIPNYNHAHFVTKAIECALQQTTAAHEIIIIDDCSTDNSVAVIETYRKQYPQIRFLQNEKNMGVVATLNRGLHEATGTHVIFAAADDWMEPDLIQQATGLLQQHPAAGFVSGTSWIVFDDAASSRSAARSPLPIRNDGYIAPQQAQKLINSLDSWFMGNTVVYNTTYMRAEGGFNPQLQSFTDNFLCRVLAAKHGCCFTPAKLATWRIRRDGYARAFSGDAQRQASVLNHALLLLNTQYRSLFSNHDIFKMQRRLNFNLARTLWNLNNGKVSPELTKQMQIALDNKTRSYLANKLLALISKLPVINTRLGNLCLFLMLRPFDLRQQLKIQMTQSKV